ncbi:MAG: thioredoxin domain-containing protein [Nanoarchaeota archaeon]|mgnify:CR=1 FL=1
MDADKEAKKTDRVEHKVSEEHAHAHSVPSLTHRMRQNPWIVSTLILAIVTLILLIGNFSGSSGKIDGASIIPKADVEAKIMSFVQSQVGNDATLVGSEIKNGLYVVTISYQGQQVPIYMTVDGENLVQGVAPFDTVLQQAQQTNSGSGTASASGSSPVNIPLDNSPAIGNANAKVTVVEFTDFSCPFCQAASGYNAQMASSLQTQNPSWQPIVSNLLKDYVDTGKVRFVTKYTFGHSGGKPAQSVAWCLNDQNLYWKFYPLAFAKSATEVEDLNLMNEIAKSIGADMTKLQSCLDSKKYDAQFAKEQAEAAAAGVSGTPSFFVNGIIVEGAVPYSQIKQMIDAELAK